MARRNLAEQHAPPVLAEQEDERRQRERIVLQDYQVQLMILEAENKKRYMQRQAQQDGVVGQIGSEQENGMLRLQGPVMEGYQVQLAALEQQHKARSMRARAEYKESQQSMNPAAQQDYQIQLMLLEQQNKKRAMMQAQDNEQPQQCKRQMVNADQPLPQRTKHQHDEEAGPSSHNDSLMADGDIDGRDPFADRRAGLEALRRKEIQADLDNAANREDLPTKICDLHFQASENARFLSLVNDVSEFEDEQDRIVVCPGDCFFKKMALGNPAVWTKPYCTFMTENPTVFHVVDYYVKKLTKLGFEQLPVRDDWTGKLKAGGKYFVTRNGSTIAAFTVGKSYEAGNGVAMIGGHIDALTARLKPVSTKPVKAGYVQLGVAPYAGGLNETWWDRDLTIGGRVVVRDGETGKTKTKLVKLGWPIARIPTLAPHFGVGMMGQMNKETQVVPVIGLDGASGSSQEPLGEAGTFIATQPPRLVQLIAKELGISSESYSSIVNWELELFDPQPATVGGMDKEFIFAGRIDDKLCSWAAMTALMTAKDDANDSGIKLVALFDDEEIGSLLRQGAKSNFLPSIIERTVEAFCHQSSSSHGGGEAKTSHYGPGILGQTYARSFLISSDVTHAANPNFLEKYLDDHAPKLNVGVVVSADSNGHMTTDSVSTAICNRVAELAGTKNQVFMIRNDSRSGGTIGPSLSSMMGVRAADVGIPQLSMHSIRATTGSLDPGLGVKFFKGFLDCWEKVDGEWQ